MRALTRRVFSLGVADNACSRVSVGGVPKTGGGRFSLSHTAKGRRLACRRREESTDVFRERYARRSGIESTNSGIKQVTGLRRLRVRGSPRVFMSIRCKVAGWNIRRGAACTRVMEFVKKRLGRGSFADNFRLFWLRRERCRQGGCKAENFGQKIAA